VHSFQDAAIIFFAENRELSDTLLQLMLVTRHFRLICFKFDKFMAESLPITTFCDIPWHSGTASLLLTKYGS